MDRQTLESILKKPYNQPLWRQVLTEVFGARNLAQKPTAITNLPSNDWEAESFELGSLETSDERVIGFYQVNLNATAKIERNRVTLRNLLRKIYKYDVDGALVVFVQNDKWRLSFVSEIRVLNEDGTTDKKETEPKRYTYLLGRDEKVKTPAARLFELAGKRFSLEDIRERFSVEVLNKEFYEKVARSFYQLVGDTEGKGKKTISHKRLLELPGVNTTKKDNDRYFKEFAVRLIGRIVFCWFLKEKMPDGGGKPLMPPELLSLDAVERTPNYYHKILEPLFFQTLNTPVNKRRDDLPDESEQIPFLNGGLFEPQKPDDYYEINDTTGFSKYINTLKVPNEWFEDFFRTLEEYNFTIDENSTTDILYGIDPEMLGRIFENLLAAIDQDTGEMARKATGSFYTPREIVDYMATESLVLYLHNETGVDKEKLHELFKVITETKFDRDEKESLLDALDRLKILDPACGSGAFPMGVLHKITLALAKLDENADWWKARQLKQITNAIIRRQVKEKLDATNAEYVRKIGIIQNTLYGVDIQPIAAEISKLRCFLTLIVDETINDKKPNRGVEPLPNLEFKFVTADALLKLPESSSQRGFFDSDEQLERLHEIRQEYLQAYGDEKIELKERFEKLQREISDRQDKNIKRDARADALSDWKPFSHEKTGWFDPEWMFGVKEFDIVIGNPPYIRQERIKHYKTIFAQTYKEVFAGTADILVYFYALGHKLLRKNGILTLITSNKFYRANYGENLRKFLSEKAKIKQIIDFGDAPVFQAAAYASINILQKDEPNKNKARVWTFPQKEKVADFQLGFNNFSFELEQYELTKESWRFEKPEVLLLLKKIKSDRITLSKYVKDFNYGIKTGLGEAFVIDEETRNQLIKQHKSSEKIIKPFLRGKDIKRWTVNFDNQYLIKIESSENVTHPWTGKPNAEEIFSQTYPAVYERFMEEDLYEKLVKRYDQGKYFWELRSCAYWKDFETPKIIMGRFMNKPTYTFDDKKYLHNDALYFIPRASKFLVAILNSSTSWYYLTKNSTDLQNGYIQALYQNQSQIPIPDATESQKLKIENLVDYILFLKSQPLEDVTDKLMPVYFEQIIDGMVYELYFGELLREHGREIIKHLGELPELGEKMSDAQKLETIRRVFKRLNDREHPVRINLFYLDSIPEIRLIEGKDANN